MEMTCLAARPERRVGPAGLGAVIVDVFRQVGVPGATQIFSKAVSRATRRPGKRRNKALAGGCTRSQSVREPLRRQRIVSLRRVADGQKPCRPVRRRRRSMGLGAFHGTCGPVLSRNQRTHRDLRADKQGQKTRNRAGPAHFGQIGVRVQNHHARTGTAGQRGAVPPAVRTGFDPHERIPCARARTGRRFKPQSQREKGIGPRPRQPKVTRHRAGATGCVDNVARGQLPMRAPFDAGVEAPACLGLLTAYQFRADQHLGPRLARCLPQSVVKTRAIHAKTMPRRREDEVLHARGIISPGRHMPPRPVGPGGAFAALPKHVVKQGQRGRGQCLCRRGASAMALFQHGDAKARARHGKGRRAPGGASANNGNVRPYHRRTPGLAGSFDDQAPGRARTPDR